LLDGELEMIIGDESKLLKPGDMYIVPGNIEHYATATDKGAKVIDIFAPVRDEFKY
jgi:quercetin dioxygenase-like cupin family protein